VARLGYGNSIVAALFVMVVGCLVITSATHVGRYPLLLLALFVLGSGITTLQVAANPLAAALGPPKWSHVRLLFAQAFNSLATVLAPWIGSHIMLRGGVFGEAAAGVDQAARRTESLRSIDAAFLMIIGMIVLVAILVWTFRKRIEASAPSLQTSERPSIMAALTSRWAVFGAIAIFLYVGAEVSIGSLLANFLHQPDVLNVDIEHAGKTVSFYWLGAMIGRFVGSLLLLFVPAGRLLSVFTVCAALLCFVVTQSGGDVAAYAAIAVGLFNSIMFPVIFTLTLERSTASQAATSGLLCMAIVGGAILPLIYAFVADRAGLHPAYFVPMIAYIGLAVFAVAAVRARVAAPNAAAPSMAH